MTNRDEIDDDDWPVGPGAVLYEDRTVNETLLCY
jgi:hypothetical protein